MRRALLGVLFALLIAAGAVADAAAAPLAQDEPRVSIVAFPDVAGEGSFWPDCPGCDGQFTAADALIATSDPLPPVDVALRDVSGGMEQTATTRPLSQGRQATGFMVPSVGSYEVELVDIPQGWALCPDEDAVVRVDASDFDPDTMLARVSFPMTRGCAALATETVPAEPATDTPVPTISIITSTPRPTRTRRPSATATATPTTEPEPEPTDDAGSGGDGGDGDGGGDPTSLGAIRGIAFQDLDGDGVLGPMEPGIEGVGVRLEGGGAALTVLTSPAGSYSFDGLGAGTYTVYVDEAPPGSAFSTTSRFEDVRVSGGTVLGIDFGFVPADGRGGRLSDRPALPHTGFIRGDGALPWLGLALLGAVLGALGYGLERRRTR